MSTLLDLDKEIFSPPELGCVLYLPGLPGGGNTLHDRSPYGNHGVITGATWKRLPSGLWYPYFDGSDDFITIIDAASIRSATGTLMFWFNTAQPASNEVIVDKREGTTDAMAIWIETSIIKIGLMKNSVWKFILAPVSATVSANTWVHTAWTFGEPGVGTKHYQGAVDVTNADTGDASDETGIDHLTSSDLLLMKKTGVAVYQEGSLALFQVYNQAFSALEIQNTFYREKHLFGV